MPINNRSDFNLSESQRSRIQMEFASPDAQVMSEVRQTQAASPLDPMAFDTETLGYALEILTARLEMVEESLARVQNELKTLKEDR